MQNNNTYNLMTQLVQEQKSLWRIEKHYINEAASDTEKAFWQSMQEDKQRHIQDLTNLIKQSL